MPLSLLETINYENCCLTSDIAECTKVVEDKIITFKKSNVKDLAEKLQVLCDHPEIVERYKSEARPYIIRKYGWDDVVERIFEIYQR